MLAQREPYLCLVLWMGVKAWCTLTKEHRLCDNGLKVYAHKRKRLKAGGRRKFPNKKLQNLISSHNIIRTNQIIEDKMKRTCSTCGITHKWVQKFGMKTWSKPAEDPNVDGRIILNWQNVNVNFTLSHSMTAGRGNRGYNYIVSLTSAQYGGGWLTPHSSRFNPVNDQVPLVLEVGWGLQPV